MAVTNSYESLWKLFGASNQLIAAIALTTITAYLARQKLPKVYTLIPAALMLATSAAALAWEAFAPGKGFFTSPHPHWGLGLICLILLGLAGLTVAKSLKGVFDEFIKDPRTAPYETKRPKFR